MATIDNLKNKELLQRLEESADLILKDNLVAEARYLARTIKKAFKRFPNLKKEDAKLYQRYEKILAKAQFVFLFDVSERELLDLVEKHLHLVLGSGYDIILNLKNHFKNINDLEKRDALKSQLRERMLKNRHKITDKKIKINSIEQEPSIANWLKDYYSKLGLDPVGALKSNQYLLNDKNTKKIADNDRELLKELFSIFEILKKSSTELGGLEENFVAILPSGGIHLIEGGRPVKIDPSLSKIIRSVSNRSSSFKGVGDSNKNEVDDVLSDDDESKSSKLNSATEQGEEKEGGGASDTDKKDISQVLRDALANYHPSSLEYRAIKEEVERIQKKQS